MAPGLWQMLGCKSLQGGSRNDNCEWVTAVVDAQENSGIPPGMSPDCEGTGPWGWAGRAAGSQAEHTLRPPESPPASTQGGRATQKLSWFSKQQQ